MKYISKGMVIRASTEDLLFVTRCGMMKRTAAADYDVQAVIMLFICMGN